MPSLDFYLDCLSDDTKDTFGGRLSRAHDMAGATLESLAGHVRVKPGLIHSWESDRAEPSPVQLMALANALQVSPMWLLAGIGEGPDENDDSHHHSRLKSA